MKYSISVEHELRIIRYTHSGLIKAEDIEEAWKDFLAMKEFTQLKYNLLADYRKGKFQIPVEALSGIIQFLRPLEDIIRNKKEALIVDEPYSVAASMLFEKEVNKEIGLIVQVFSTEVSAIRWLLF